MFTVRVRVRVFGLGFFVRVSVRVSVTDSGAYLNENFIIIYRLCCHLVSVPEKTAELKIVILFIILLYYL